MNGVTNTKNKLLIYPFEYEITFKGPNTHEDLNGHTVTDDKTIEIFVDATDQRGKEVVLHEILHALYDEIFNAIKDIKDPEEMEEAFNRLFSPRLLGFIQDNKEAIHWLSKKENK